MQLGSDLDCFLLFHFLPFLVHHHVLSALCWMQLQNPFTPIGARITSPNFLTKLDKLVETFNSKTLK